MGTGKHFPFYESRFFVEELLKCRLLGRKVYLPNSDDIWQQLIQNPNILPPEKVQVDRFLEIFDLLRRDDEVLRNLEIDDSYKEEIFQISDNTDLLIRLVSDISRTASRTTGMQQHFPKEITSIHRISPTRQSAETMT